MPISVPLLAAGAGAGAFVLGKLLTSSVGGSGTAAPAAADSGAAPAAQDPASLDYGTAGLGPGVLQGIDQSSSGYDSGGLPGGGASTPPPAPTPTPGPAPAPTPTTAPSTASAHYSATVTVATALWNDDTKRWVYNGPNAIKVGTRLIVRGARYTKGNVSCYPIVSPFVPNYYVPAAHVRLIAKVA